MFRPLDDRTFLSPSGQLKNFTNRVSEHGTLNALLAIRGTKELPLTMFYGVGGAGKSWLLRSFYKELGDIPKAHIDLDPRNLRQTAQTDPATVLANIRQQLGPSVKCPRFDLAYAWLRYKDGGQKEPLFEGAGMLGFAWKIVASAAAAAADSVTASFFVNLFNSMTGSLTGKLNDLGIKEYLDEKLGQEDFLSLRK